MQHTAGADRLRKRLGRRGYEIFRTREVHQEERTPHCHDFYEVTLIWSGSMHYRVGARSYHLTNGDILLLSPGQEHQPEPEKGPCERMVLWIGDVFLNQFRSLGFDPTACFEETQPGGSCLRFDGSSYNGWYLYAAATLPEYRSKGLMGRLIKEAQQFCINEGYDYISLVPADEGLYGYYGSFGFHEAMYCCRSIFYPSHDKNRSCSLITDREHIKIMRDAYKGNMFAYKNKACDYALSVLSAGDADFLQLTDTAYCIYDSNDCQVIEFICDEKKISQEAEILMKAVKRDNLTVYSPYDLSKITDESFIEKFGMIYPVNKKLIREWKLTDIYMNLALN